MEKRVWVILSAVIFVFALQLYPFSVGAAKTNKIPPMITGTWVASQLVTVRFEDERGEYRFVSDTVIIRITIDADGLVDGICGNAVFSGCVADENRGWFGRFLNISSDFVFEGNLTGKIFERDPFPQKAVRAVFDMKDGYLIGILFQKEGWDKHQMVNFKLGKR